MSCRTSTAPRPAADATGAPRATNVAAASPRERQLAAFAGQAVKSPVDLGGDVGMPRDLEIVTFLGRVFDLQHAARGVVDHLQPSLRRDDQHAFAHAVEDRFHARAIGFALRHATADFTHRVIQCAGHDADFVGAVVGVRRREVARGVALSHLRDRSARGG